MIRRGDDPDKPRERHVKSGAFIKVEKDEKPVVKMSADEVAAELIGNKNTVNFMKTDFTHDVKIKPVNAEERAKVFDTTISDINTRHAQATQDYRELKKYSSM